MTEEQPLFGTTSKFSQAYPEIKTLKITVAQDAAGYYSRGNHRQSSTFNESNVRGKLQCCNSACQRGGINLDSFIRRATRDRAAELSDSAVCCGDEGSPKGKREGKPCMNFFEITAEITYRD